MLGRAGQVKVDKENTVIIDGAGNAALLAAEILALSDEALALRLEQKRKNDTLAVLEKNKDIEAQFNV